MAYWVKVLQSESEESQFKPPKGAQPDLGTQPWYMAPVDPQMEIIKMQWLTSGEWGCPLNNNPTLAMGQPNSIKKRNFANLIFLVLGYQMIKNLLILPATIFLNFGAAIMDFFIILKCYVFFFLITLQK